MIGIGDLLGQGLMSPMNAIRKRMGALTAAERSAAAITESDAEWFEERVAEVEERIRVLEETDKSFRRSDVRPILQGVARVHGSTADPGKRRLLEAAARNVDAAYDRIGERWYPHANCEHLVREVHGLESESPQLREKLALMGGGVAVGGLALLPFAPALAAAAGVGGAATVAANRRRRR